MWCSNFLVIRGLLGLWGVCCIMFGDLVLKVRGIVMVMELIMFNYNICRERMGKFNVSKMLIKMVMDFLLLIGSKKAIVLWRFW